MMQNPWGRRYLMCPPDHFTVEYAINPWMTPDEPVDPEMAAKQWGELASAIEEAGGTVETIDASPELPDMVFTANLGVLNHGHLVVSTMRHAERKGEAAVTERWARTVGVGVQSMPVSSGTFEGMGDALPFGDLFIAGYGPRSDRAAWDAIQRAVGWPITAIELPDERFYHIDLVFSPLDDRRALIAPVGLTEEGLDTLCALVPEPVILEDREAMLFSANSIVVGSTVIMPACSERLRGVLTEAGFTVVVVNVGEFLKAGGAVRCLTLPLDVRLGPVPPTLA